uniref:Nucleocapsid protein n=1 Tax=Blattella germanica orthomyxovirus 1 TaxID=3133491 RepID=A0AAT9JH54_9ORTO
MSSDEQTAGPSNPEVMETDAPAPAVKRKHEEILDPDSGEMVADPKKPKIDLDSKKKVSVLKFIIRSATRLWRAIPNLPDESFQCLNISIQVANLLFTCYSIKRQESNQLVGNMAKKTDTKSFTVTYKAKEYHLEKETALGMVSEAAEKEGLVFKAFKETDTDNWYGVAGPYLNFFCAFGLRMQELRIGHDKMPIGKKAGVTSKIQVHKYGLYGSHHILLEGCTYPPEKRSSMAQSIGPMTALLCYIRSDGKYAAKWKRACKRAMSHVPFIDEILEVVKGKKATELIPLISTLADIICITTSRQAQRMAFPILQFCEASCSRAKPEKNEYTFNEAVLEHVNFSGEGGFAMYKAISEGCRELTLMGNMSEQKAAQIVYHSIFGTFKEDLGVLANITNCATWYTREEMGKCFQQASSTGNVVKVKLIKQVYYSKLASANQTGLLAASYNQTTSAPVFSGSRIHAYDEEFFESIARRSGATTSGRTLDSLIQALKTVYKDLETEVRKRGMKLEMGTVAWKSTENLAFGRPGAQVNVVVEGTRKFFLGQSQKL